jgi:hypothetical protein
LDSEDNFLCFILLNYKWDQQTAKKPKKTIKNIKDKFIADPWVNKLLRNSKKPKLHKQKKG